MKGLIFVGGGGVVGKGGGVLITGLKKVCQNKHSRSLFFSWSINQNAQDTQMTMCMTEDARRERHKKRETTRKARENGLSRSSDFFGMKTEVLIGQACETCLNNRAFPSFLFNVSDKPVYQD